VVAAAAVSDMVEVDLRLTADEVVVLSHELELGGLEVAGTAWEELRAVDLGDGQLPVSLADLLAGPGLVPLDLEVKNMPGEDSIERGALLARMVADLARTADVVTSFWWPGMDELRVTHPQVATGLIVAEQGSLSDAVTHAEERGHSWVVPYWTLVHRDRDAVAAAETAGLEVVVWGLADPSAATALAAAGVDGLIVDDPPAFVEALAG
jgi:glycerophosphoryl diester phosphodiesterase